MSSFDLAIPVVMKHEGGYANDPSDPGGETNFGVSLRYLKELPAGAADFNHDGFVDGKDIRCMSKDDACAIYRREWWDRYHYGSIRYQDIATKILDMAINMGSSQAHKILQRALNLCGVICSVDGVFGAKTLDAINYAQSDMLLAMIRSEQAAFYRKLVALKPGLSKFLKGWLARASS